MKSILAAGCLCAAVHADPTAPTLFEARMDPDGTSATLKWRNNDFAADSFAVYRRSSADSAWSPRGRVPASVTAFADRKLRGGMSYCYRVDAMEEGAGAAASDTLCAGAPRVLAAPRLESLRWNPATGTVSIRFSERSNSETRHAVYRKKSGEAFALIREIPVSDPSGSDTLVVEDSSLSANAWFSYRVVSGNGGQEEAAEDSLPTTYFGSLFAGLRTLTTVRVVGETPLADAGWSFKAGDSLLVMEGNGPVGSYSVIDVSDPAKPLFKGYQATDLPAFSHSVSLGDMFIGMAGQKLLSYRRSGGSFRKTGEASERFKYSAGFRLMGDSSLLFLNDGDDYFGYRGVPNSCNSLYTYGDTGLVFRNRTCHHAAGGLIQRDGDVVVGNHFLYQVNNMGVSYVDYLDYASLPPRFVSTRVKEVPGWNDLPGWPNVPKDLPGFTVDATMAKARAIHLDSARSLAWLLLADRLQAVEYRSGRYGVRLAERKRIPGPRGRRRAGGPSAEGARLLFDANGRFLGTGTGRHEGALGIRITR